MAREVESRIARRVREITPDVLPEILLRLDQQEGEAKMREGTAAVVLTDNITDISQGRETAKKRRSWTKWAASVAAVFVLILGTYFAYGNYRVDSVVDFDVNPGIQITVNSSEKVLKAEPMNADAVVVLEDMELKNVSLDVAVNALIGSMLKHGYINELANSILITVENSDAEKAATLQSRLTSEVTSLLSAYAIDSAVISQSHTVKSADISELAQQYSITYGKAELINKLIRLDNTLAFADMAKLSVNEIKLLLEARQTTLDGVTTEGSASSAAYIGESAAFDIAMQHAGVTAAETTFYKIKLDYEDGRMVYETEFRTAGAEFDCDVDALTGEIVSFERESIGALPTGGNSGGGTASDGSQSPQIGVDAAKEAALSHAGLAASQVTFTKAKLDYDDGHAVYDIEFYSGEYEYDFEIDAVTGAILDYDREYDDDRAVAQPSSPVSQPSTPASPPQSGGADNTADAYISVESAKAAALSHAGLDASQVTYIKAERDHDDGRVIYEIEFRCGSMEYEYEIDAATGAVLKADSEYDD